MAPKTQNALELCLALAEQEHIISPIKEPNKISYFSGCVAFAGGVWGGPLGFLSGAFLAAVGSELFLNNNRSCIELLIDSLVGSMTVTLITLISGLIAGEKGLYIGAVISTIMVWLYSSPKFKSAKTIIECDMTTEEKHKLGRDAQTVLSSLDINDVSLLLLIVSKCPELKKALMNKINSTIRRKQRRQEIEQKHAPETFITLR